MTRNYKRRYAKEYGCLATMFFKIFLRTVVDLVFKYCYKYEIIGKENLKNQFSNEIRYCESVDATESTAVLKQYYALIFPTRFYTEGVPGTIIDAYAAGIPVISSKCQSYSDVIEDGITGIGYEFDNIEHFKEILLSVAHNSEMLFDMKENCIRKAKEYVPESTIQIMTLNFLNE